MRLRVFICASLEKYFSFLIMDTAVHKAKVQVDYSPLHSLVRTLVKQLEA